MKLWSYVRDIFIDMQKPDDFVAFMQKSGKACKLFRAGFYNVYYQHKLLIIISLIDNALTSC